MTCGSVDDGKSTILGNLLYATGNIEKDIYENLDVETKKFRNNSSGIDFSLLLDGLIDEKEQGITIDIAFKYFYINQKKFVFIDSPGHIEFTRNMANAATFADLAIILIDVNRGVTDQTLKHIEIANMFQNIKEIVFCVNKMDLINYKQRHIK